MPFVKKNVLPRALRLGKKTLKNLGKSALAVAGDIANNVSFQDSVKKRGREQFDKFKDELGNVILNDGSSTTSRRATKRRNKSRKNAGRKRKRKRANNDIFS